MRSRTSEHSPGRPPDQSPPRTSVDGCRRRAQRHPATPETLRPVAPLPPAPAATARSLASALPMRVDAPDPPMGRSPRVSSSSGISRGGGVPGTPDACITPPPAPLPRALTLKGGFTVLDPQQRRLDRQARAQGYSDPHSYLLARAQQHASPAQLARELGTTTTAARRLLDTAGVTPSPRQVSAAHTWRTSTDQQLTTRAAKLGFASLQDYLTDRAMARRWPSTSIASELGVHPGTVRDRLNQHDLPRHRATVRPYRAIQRQRACWAAKRQARLAELGVGSAWLKDQMHRLCTP